MTEAEWLTGSDYPRMYAAVRDRTTVRQVRLYMVACCRLMTPQFFDPRIADTLKVAEQCADDPWAEAAAEVLWEQWVTSALARSGTGPHGDVARAIQGAWELVGEVSPETNYEPSKHVELAISQASLLCLRSKPRQVFTGGDGDAAEHCARCIDRAIVLGNRVTSGLYDFDGGCGAIADLLRDIFGNPFRPDPFSPSWRSFSVVNLAASMYDSRDFSAMPVLADALEEAGCTDIDILSHCREQEGHVRGCWVVDGVLNKT